MRPTEIAVSSGTPGGPYEQVSLRKTVAIITYNLLIRPVFFSMHFNVQENYLGILIQ